MKYDVHHQYLIYCSKYTYKYKQKHSTTPTNYCLFSKFSYKYWFKGFSVVVYFFILFLIQLKEFFSSICLLFQRRLKIIELQTNKPI